MPWDYVEPLLFLVAAPFFLFPSMGRWATLFILPLTLVIVGRCRREILPVTPLNGAIALLMVMVGVSLWATFDLSFSLGKVAGLLLGIWGFFVVVRLCTNLPRWMMAAVLLSLAGCTLAFLALLGTNWIEKVGGLRRVTSLLPAVIRGVPGQEEGFQPNAVAGVLVLVLPLQGALAFSKSCLDLLFDPAGFLSGVRKAPTALVLRGMFVVTAATFLLTQSRGAWLGLGASGLAWLAWSGRRGKRAAIAGFVVALTIALAVGPERVGRELFRHAGTGLQGDLAGRLALWSCALKGIEDFPFTGMGMNTFRKVMPVLYPTSLSDASVEVPHAHNQLLQVALDLGLPGLVGYVALWLGAFGAAAACIRNRRNEAVGVLGSALACGLLAHFVFGIGDAVALGAKAGIFFWLTLGLLVALLRVWSRRESPAVGRGTE
jgi:putative inorganic carbon (HCO3(-)) transporter